MKYHNLALDFSQTDFGKSVSLLNIAECYLELGNNEKFFSYINEIKDNLCDDYIKGVYFKLLGKYCFNNVYFSIFIIITRKKLIKV